MPHVAQNRGQRRSEAVRDWHRKALDGWAKAYDLDCSGELAGKCSRCLRDLYVWEDSRDPQRATSYTKETARNLGVPGFFILYDTTADDSIAWMKVAMIYPERIVIGGAVEFALYLRRLRRAHQLTHHRPLELIAR